MRTICCPICHQTMTGDWTVVRCYCTEWAPTGRSFGNFLMDDEVVRFDGEHVVAVSIYA